VFLFASNTNQTNLTLVVVVVVVELSCVHNFRGFYGFFSSTSLLFASSSTIFSFVFCKNQNWSSVACGVKLLLLLNCVLLWEAVNEWVSECVLCRGFFVFWWVHFLLLRCSLSFVFFMCNSSVRGIWSFVACGKQSFCPFVCDLAELVWCSLGVEIWKEEVSRSFPLLLLFFSFSFLFLGWVLLIFPWSSSWRWRRFWRCRLLRLEHSRSLLLLFRWGWWWWRRRGDGGRGQGLVTLILLGLSCTRIEREGSIVIGRLRRRRCSPVLLRSWGSKQRWLQVWKGRRRWRTTRRGSLVY